MYTTYINPNGTKISIGTKLKKYLKVKTQNVEPTHIQHTNSVTNIATNERVILENDMEAIAQYVKTL